MRTPSVAPVALIDSLPARSRSSSVKAFGGVPLWLIASAALVFAMVLVMAIFNGLLEEITGRSTVRPLMIGLQHYLDHVEDVTAKAFP